MKLGSDDLSHENIVWYGVVNRHKNINLIHFDVKFWLYVGFEIFWFEKVVSESLLHCWLDNFDLFPCCIHVENDQTPQKQYFFDEWFQHGETDIVYFKI